MRARVDPIARDACNDVAGTIATDTRGRVPRRSGRLAASVSRVPDPDGARVVMSAPYAGWIEYGGTRGRPYVADGRYLGAAARGADRKIAAQAERDLEREARAW